MPAPIPRGTPMILAKPRIKIEPPIAFAIPPPASPTGFGVCVRNAQFSAPAPLYRRYPKMATRGSNTRTTAPPAATVASASTVRRRMLTKEMPAFSPESDIAPRRSPTRYRPHQQLGENVHDDRHQKQRQSNLYQRTQI